MYVLLRVLYAIIPAFIAYCHVPTPCVKMQKKKFPKNVKRRRDHYAKKHSNKVYVIPPLFAYHHSYTLIHLAHENVKL